MKNKPIKPAEANMSDDEALMDLVIQYGESRLETQTAPINSISDLKEVLLELVDRLDDITEAAIKNAGNSDASKKATTSPFCSNVYTREKRHAIH